MSTQITHRLLPREYFDAVDVSGNLRTVRGVKISDALVTFIGPTYVSQYKTDDVETEFVAKNYGGDDRSEILSELVDHVVRKALVVLADTVR